MRSETPVSPRAPSLAPGTLAELVLAAGDRFVGTAAFQHKTAGGWTEVSYAALVRTVRELAAGLIDLGVERGDRVALFAGTRPEWSWAHYAALCAGAVLVPLYPTSSVEEVRHILRHSGAKVAVVEATEHLGKVRTVRGDLPELDEVVVIDPDGDPTGATLTLDELARHGRRQPGPLERRLAEIEPTDLAAILYTSGTTGPPKGCMLDHAAWLATVAMTARALPLRPGERGYLFLPLAHAFAHLVELVALECGGTLVFWEGDMAKIAADLAATRPHYFPSVPRLFEKLHAVITRQVAESNRMKRALFSWGLRTGRQARGTGPRPLGRLAKARLAVADRLVLAKVRGVLGGQIKQCITGAAPIAPEILEYFWAIGVPVLESYGMTESPAIALNRPDDVRIGSVGKPLPGMRITIADDGEILLQGPNLLRGYYRDEAATAAAIRDGWLHTGDLGRLDGDGFLYITGRKKELIITATGKNVAPVEIENALRQQRGIAQAVVCGDRRPYVSALVAVDAEEVAHAREDARALVERAVDVVNARLSRAAQVKRFTMLPRELSQEAGELTPTLKLKRAVISQRYADLIDRMYNAS